MLARRLRPVPPPSCQLGDGGEERGNSEVTSSFLTSLLLQIRHPGELVVGSSTCRGPMSASVPLSLPCSTSTRSLSSPNQLHTIESIALVWPPSRHVRGRFSWQDGSRALAPPTTATSHLPYQCPCHAAGRQHPPHGATG